MSHCTSFSFVKLLLWSLQCAPVYFLRSFLWIFILFFLLIVSHHPHPSRQQKVMEWMDESEYKLNLNIVLEPKHRHKVWKRRSVTPNQLRYLILYYYYVPVCLATHFSVQSVISQPAAQDTKQRDYNNRNIPTWEKVWKRCYPHFIWVKGSHILSNTFYYYFPQNSDILTLGSWISLFCVV